MRTSSQPSLKEGRANPPAPLPQFDRGAGKGNGGNGENEGNTACSDNVAGLSKACDTLDEQPLGGTRGLIVRGLPLVFLPQNVETLWELVAAADVAAASDEATSTAAEVIRAERASAEAPGTAAVQRMAWPASSTQQTQDLPRQDTQGSRPPLLKASSESTSALTARPPSPTEQHASLQRKHIPANASGQRKNPPGQGKEPPTVPKQTKNTNGGATGPVSRAAVPVTAAGLPNSTSPAMTAPAGIATSAGGIVSGVQKHSCRPAASGAEAAGNVDASLHTDIRAEVEREKRFKPKGDIKDQLRELICQQLSKGGSASAERQKTYTSAAVVELHVFSLIFAGTIGLCSKKAALYLSIIAASVEDLEQEKKRLNLSPLRQVESLRKRIRRQTFDPFVKYTPDSPPEGDALPAAACTFRPHSVYPTFSRMEAQKLFHFASETFVGHSRLYSYCMKYPRKQVANIDTLHTYIPLAPPLCTVAATSLTTIENVPKTSSAVPVTGEGSLTLQQEGKRSGEAPLKPL